MVDIMRLGVADQRDEIIFGEFYNRKKYGGGFRRFDELTLEQIDKLEDLGVLDMDDAYTGQNLPRARRKPATPPEKMRQLAGEGCQCKRETTYCEEHTKNV